MMATFMLRCNAGERCLRECVIERHSGLTPGAMVWGAILYHGRSDLLRIEDNLDSDGRPPVPEIQLQFLYLPCLQETGF
ncbi:hypothetical protein TNCV_3949141 [Trichonephila clavipes]|nr:hypothetical protein TNCV_3949141 [Trichonephila clavipes]